MVKRAARVREQARGGGGMVAELTVISTEDSAGSGTGCGRRIGDGDRRCPRLKMMSMRRYNASPVAWLVEEA